jgi:TetR/AcrR family transcriptional regulator, transcriptional repressor for nem operon
MATPNRDRVLEVAATLFRERGLNGACVAELMNTTSLTPGGFYSQFESKEDLQAQACRYASEQVLESWRQAESRRRGGPLAALVTAYVSTPHRDDPGTGCVVAALGAEAAREGPNVRRVISDAAKSLFDTMVGVVSGKTGAQKRERAAVTLASMVGAVVLARAIEDEALSREMLRAVRFAMSQGAPPDEGECPTPLTPEWKRKTWRPVPRSALPKDAHDAAR